MIIVTGALGFIGSSLIRKLNDEGHDKNILAVDDFYKSHKDPNLANKYILNYSKRIWEICTQYQIPLVYASSAATYGNGKQGYKDDHKLIPKLKPLNQYAKSKQSFDEWVLKQKKTPPYWAGLKFFNVYGPNEYHKKRMASVVYHTAEQIKATGKMKLFKSHNSKFKNGEQQRDFIYIKDVVDVCHFLYNKQKQSGIYNIGTGEARTFLDLANATFKAMDIESNISFINTPADIRKNYQYFTQADISKLRKLGYKKKFHSLEDGIQDYVKHYLRGKKIW